MQKGEISQTCYSAEVDLYFEIGDKKLSVRQVCAGTAIVETPTDYPPGTIAKLCIVIDGHLSRKEVVLDNGISSATDEVTYSNACALEFVDGTPF